MALELIAILVAAFAGWGMGFGLRRLSKGRLPKWLAPVTAGLALIATSVTLEYGWFGRVSDTLPQGVEIVWQDGQPQALRPWTYLVPLTSRFAAIDRRDTRSHPSRANLRLVTLYNFARWQPVGSALMAVDCAALRKVLLTEGVSIDDTGTLTGAEWGPAEPADTVIMAACREE